MGQGSSQGARIRPWAGVPSTLGWGSSREAGFDLGDSDLRLPWRPASDPEVEVQVDARTPSAVSLRSPVRVRDDLRPRMSDSLRGQPAIASPSSCRSQTGDLGFPWRPKSEIPRWRSRWMLGPHLAASLRSPVRVRVDLGPGISDSAGRHYRIGVPPDKPEFEPGFLPRVVDSSLGWGSAFQEARIPPEKLAGIRP